MRLDRTMSAILVKIKPEYKSFLCDDGSMIVCLDKALYDELCGTLLDLGYTRNAVDQCEGVGPNQCTMCVHVDDLMITCCENAIIDALLAGLTDKYKTLTVHRGNVHSYLGMTWDFTVARKVKVTMEGYVDDIPKSYDVKGTAATPASSNLFELRKSEELNAESSTMHGDLFRAMRKELLNWE